MLSWNKYENKERSVEPAAKELHPQFRALAVQHRTENRKALDSSSSSSAVGAHPSSDRSLPNAAAHSYYY